MLIAYNFFFLKRRITYIKKWYICRLNLFDPSPFFRARLAFTLIKPKLREYDCRQMGRRRRPSVKVWEREEGGGGGEWRLREWRAAIGGSGGHSLRKDAQLGPDPRWSCVAPADDQCPPLSTTPLGASDRRLSLSLSPFSPLSLSLSSAASAVYRPVGVVRPR